MALCYFYDSIEFGKEKAIEKFKKILNIAESPDIA